MFRSTDGGANWGAANAGLSAANVTAIAADSAGVIYLGTADAGVFKSIDYGVTWSAANTGISSANIQSIVVDPSNNATLLAGTLSSGVFRSFNFGANWLPSSSGLTTTDVRALAIDPSNSSIAYAATFNGMFKTTNGTSSWVAVNNGYSLLTGVAGGFAVAIDPANVATVYAGSNSDSGVFKTTNGGGLWAAANAGLTAGGTPAP